MHFANSNSLEHAPHAKFPLNEAPSTGQVALNSVYKSALFRSVDFLSHFTYFLTPTFKPVPKLSLSTTILRQSDAVKDKPAQAPGPAMPHCFQARPNKRAEPVSYGPVFFLSPLLSSSTLDTRSV